MSVLGTVKTDDVAAVLRRMPRQLESLCLTAEDSQHPRDFDAGAPRPLLCMRAPSPRQQTSSQPAGPASRPPYPPTTARARMPACPPKPYRPRRYQADTFLLPTGTELVQHLRHLKELSLYSHRRHNLATLSRRVNMIRILVGGLRV